MILGAARGKSKYRQVIRADHAERGTFEVLGTSGRQCLGCQPIIDRKKLNWPTANSNGLSLRLESASLQVRVYAGQHIESLVLRNGD